MTLFLSLMILSGVLRINGELAASGEALGDSGPIVLFHQSKGQYFNSSLMSSALSSLESAGYTVLVSSIPINSTSLIGVDAMIVTNPERGNVYSQDEGVFIKKWLEESSHGLFLLNNPLSTNTSLQSSPETLNNLIIQVGLFQGNQFELGAKNDGTLLRELDLENDSDSSLLVVDLDRTTTFTFPENAQAVSRSNHVETSIPIVQIGTRYFAQTSDGSIRLQGKSPVILGGGIHESTSSRLLLSGSTLMFSDLVFGPSPNSSWFGRENNSLLWVKAINWVSGLEDESNERYTADYTGLYLSLGTGLLLMGGGFTVFMMTNPSTQTVSPPKASAKTARKEKQDVPRSENVVSQTAEQEPIIDKRKNESTTSEKEQEGKPPSTGKVSSRRTSSRR